MFEQVDLSRKLSKDEYKKELGELQDKMAWLQVELWNAKVPMLVVFEGWDASGKGGAIKKYIEHLDPRGFKMFPVMEATREEELHPFLWRFWKKVPARGRIAIFNRSWYRRVLEERIEKKIEKDNLQKAFDEVRIFERQLADDDAVIVKFWMHISKKEQKKRFKKSEAEKYMSWKIDKEDWEQNRKYNKYYKIVEESLQKTSTHYAPWTIVEAEDDRWAQVKVLKSILEAGIKGLNQKKKKDGARKVKGIANTEKITKHSHPTILDRVDLSLKLDDKDYDKQLTKYQARLRELQFKAYKERVPVIVMYEGWDAGGKGGNIKRFTEFLDPRGYEVVPISAPSSEEKAHHFLWRFWNQIPKAGHCSLFDRSWYGRLLVERVEGFCSEDDWQRSYQEINEFEQSMADSGAVICKFWLQISKEEQLARFNERKKTDYKKYKITDEDWRNRKKWDSYEEAVLDMLERTSTTYAPWTIVEGEDKNWARVKTVKTACDAIEKRLKKI